MIIAIIISSAKWAIFRKPLLCLIKRKRVASYSRSIILGAVKRLTTQFWNSRSIGISRRRERSSGNNRRDWYMKSIPMRRWNGNFPHSGAQTFVFHHINTHNLQQACQYIKTEYKMLLGWDQQLLHDERVCKERNSFFWYLKINSVAE